MVVPPQQSAKLPSHFESFASLATGIVSVIALGPHPVSASLTMMTTTSAVAMLSPTGAGIGSP
jgi:hypothetical protein